MGSCLAAFCFFQPLFYHVDIPLVGEERVAAWTDFVRVATELRWDVEYGIISLYRLDADLERSVVAGLDDEIVAV